MGSVCFLTEETSNTPTANIILPILAAVSTETLTHPLVLMLPATCACSFAFMFPAATPPNSVVFATKRVGIRDFLRVGFILNILAIIFGSLIIYGMGLIVYDIGAPFPQWACLPDDCVWIDFAGVV